jgi:hypothetical protein
MLILNLYSTIAYYDRNFESLINIYPIYHKLINLILKTKTAKYLLDMNSERLAVKFQAIWVHVFEASF